MADLHGLQTVDTGTDTGTGTGTDTGTDTGTSERIKSSPTSCRALWLLLGALATSPIVSCSDGPHPNGNGTEFVEDEEGPTITMNPIDIDVGTDEFYCSHDGRKGSVVIKKGDEQIGVEVSSFSDAGGIKSAELLDKSGGTIQNGSKVQAFALRVTDMSNNISEKAFIYNSVNHFNSLEDFRNLNIHAGEEVNFLNLIKFDGKYISSLLKNHQINDFKIKINNILVDDPSSYIFYEPGNYELYFELIDSKGEQYNSKVNINVLDAEYEEPNIEEINIFEIFPHCKERGKERQEEILQYLTASLIESNLENKENGVHIVVGEDPGTPHCNSITNRIKLLLPDANIKYIKNLASVEEYVSQNPNTNFYISIAHESGGGETKEKFNNNNENQIRKRISSSSNVVSAVAGGNPPESESGADIVLNEDYPYNSLPNATFRLCSTNPEGDSNFTSTCIGWDCQSPESNTFGKGYGKNGSRFPYYFPKEKNRVVLFQDLNNPSNTTSSFPTQGVILLKRFCIDFVMANGINFEVAKKIANDDRYREPITLYYKRGDQELKSVGYRFNMNLFIEDWILHQGAISILDISGEIIPFPLIRGVIYMGNCMEYLKDGEWHKITKNTDPLTIYDVDGWRLNPSNCKDGDTSIRVGVLHESGKLIIKSDEIPLKVN